VSHPNTVPDDEGGPAAVGGPSYQYRAAVIGAPWELKLKQTGLEWAIGRHAGLLRYEHIRKVRLSFRPVSMQPHRFLTEIWSADAPKIQIASTTWRSVMEQARQDAPYAAFIRDLHRRIAAAGAPATFERGIPRAVYVVGVLLFSCLAIALVGLTLRALQLGEWPAAVMVGGFLALFAWQGGSYFRRNRPGGYRPDALPTDVLPRSKN
jgi:hypothetical protein